MWLWREPPLARWAAWDLRCTRRLHAWADHPWLLPPLCLASRAADGLGYLLLTLLPLFDGPRGLRCMGQMAAAAAINLALYWLIKQACARARPCHRHADIRARLRVPDRYSFPSGHTIHAVAFALLLGAHYPVLVLPAALFVALVALSRVVLGLHYPSDVLAGAAIGAATASAVMWVARSWSGPAGLIG